ncbi:carbon-nitrogen hydrolase family protein [Alteromonas oceanisediminis]|uniref:carbon-nitrogen hydrolase family protein n=1 Tax=Alteromonas oceanisediminis TaxID=2836180 RepID=UPI001BDB4D0A|nr:carbon-nitrogen hydrolase family protein [Alteromonas oceanisediminis]MBT0586887.1 carbon-nitrogen hydrolase family protein [Alteromonas oceanisediminis]
MTNVTAIQMISTPEVDENLAQLTEQLDQLSISAPHLVVLPECFARFGSSDKQQLALAQEQAKAQDGTSIFARLQQIASHYQVWLVCGTVPAPSDSADHFRARCWVIDDKGQYVTHYDKIHLFDVSVDDSTGDYKESRFTEPGERVVTFDSPFGRVGLAVCYDVRFPGLFQAMPDVDVVVLPSAFTQKTGEAHWHALLKARSIELQAFMVGANQGGVHANGRETYGNSVIYSPWGKQLALIEKGVGSVTAPLKLSEIPKIRQSMPIMQHKKFRSHFDKSS